MYVKFDLSSLPKKAIIESAILKFTEIPYAESAFFYKTSPVTDYQLDANLFIHRVLTDWSETTTTDFIAPFTNVNFDSLNYEDSFAYSTGAGEMSFNITGAIKNMVDNPNSNYGFMMRSDYRFSYAKNPGGSMTYWHSSQSEELLKRPVLSVTYSEDGNTYKKDIYEINTKTWNCSYRNNETLRLQIPYNGEYNLKIMNIKGQLLLQKEITVKSKITNISVGNISSEMVIAKICNGENSKTFKVKIK